MQTTLTIIQIVAAVALVLLILLQSRGAGLGGIFGGSSNIYATKRGIERVLFMATIVSAALFMGSALAIVLL